MLYPRAPMRSQAWYVADATNPSDGGSSTVRVEFKSSHMESLSTLMVYTELDVDDASSEAELPRLECLDVRRQTGRLGVVKVANVEVHEHRCARFFDQMTGRAPG